MTRAPSLRLADHRPRSQRFRGVILSAGDIYNFLGASSVDRRRTASDRCSMKTGGRRSRGNDHQRAVTDRWRRCGRERHRQAKDCKRNRSGRTRGGKTDTILAGLAVQYVSNRETVGVVVLTDNHSQMTRLRRLGSRTQSGTGVYGRDHGPRVGRRRW